MFPTEEGWKLYNTVNVLNAMELYMLKWLILCCVNFTSKKKDPQNQETTHTVHPIIARGQQGPQLLAGYKLSLDSHWAPGPPLPTRMS